MERSARWLSILIRACGGAALAIGLLLLAWVRAVLDPAAHRIRHRSRVRFMGAGRARMEEIGAQGPGGFRRHVGTGHLALWRRADARSAWTVSLDG